MAGGQKSAAAFLIAELRRARMSRGLSQEDLGRAINYSGSLVSAVELGQQAPTAKYLELVDEAVGTSGLFGRMLAELVSLDRVQPWLRGARAIVSQARMLRWYEPLYVPGLLQTEGYARAVFEAGGLLDPSEVERRLVERMEQQGILLGGHPPQLVAVVDEAALRRRVGDAKVMADQAMHLARTASEHRWRSHGVERRPVAEEQP